MQRLLAERLLCRIDPARVYVTGISAGGGMAMVLAATHPDLFAAVGVHSAPPYRSATRPGRAVAAMQGRVLAPPPPSAVDVSMPPLVVFQGTHDLTVRRVNARRLAHQWLDWYDEPTPVGDARSRRHPAAKPFTGTGARSHTVTHWTVGRHRVLEVWEVDGLGHAWSGGAADSSYSDPRGPRASTQLWRFFSRHVNEGSGVGARRGA